MSTSIVLTKEANGPYLARETPVCFLGIAWPLVRASPYFQLIIQPLLIMSLLHGFSALTQWIYTNLAIISFIALQFLQQIHLWVYLIIWVASSLGTTQTLD